MTSVLDVLAEHTVSISEGDEELIDSRRYNPAWTDADLAVRTCLCGVSLTGYSEYHEHLKEVIEESIQ